MTARTPPGAEESATTRERGAKGQVVQDRHRGDQVQAFGLERVLHEVAGNERDGRRRMRCDSRGRGASHSLWQELEAGDFADIGISMKPDSTDPRKWLLGAVAVTLLGVRGLLGYVASQSTKRVEKTYTVAPPYVARNIVDLSRMPDASFLQIADTDHIRIDRQQDDAAMVEVLEGEFRGQKGWVRIAWLQEGR